MSKVDLGIKVAKKMIGFLNAGNGKSLLYKQPSIFHGINPRLTYPPSGKTFALPRFCSEEMNQARKMNKIATNQIKTSAQKSYSKASAEDLKRLTSETIEDSYSRVQWTNPKDNKVYNLLKQGTTEDGNVLIRILDEEGKFLKEATIKPKEIAIIDNSYGSAFELPYYLDEINMPKELNELSHAKAVEIFAKRNNPFAKYTIFETGVQKGSTDIDGNKLINHIKNLQQGKKYDYVNCSLGSATDDITEASKPIFKKIGEEIDKLHSTRGSRVFFASGNSDGGAFHRKTTNRHLINSNTAEGVGSLNRQGRISNFSSSRNSKFCQHYEQGEFLITQKSNGINITGQPGTDIVFSEKNPFIGMKLGDILKKCDEKPELWKYMQKLGFNGESMDSIAHRIFPEKIHIDGTSFATPIRTAKLALNDMMQGIL